LTISRPKAPSARDPNYAALGEDIGAPRAIFLIFTRFLAYLHSMSTEDVCAVILAGGQSRRMGSNKALLEIGGKPLISILVERILPVTDRILISSNDVSSYQFLDFPVIPDYFTGHGPLAGFHSTMTRNVCSLYIMLACDLPDLKTPLLQQLVAMAQGFDAAIPRTLDGLAHPLCAIYRRTCLPSVEHALRRGANKVIDPFLEDSLAVRWISPEEGKFEDADLANINTPEDLRNLGISPKPGSGPSLNM
jgi:molybdopterin-guanine dinucleotide biosynthesis protein A